MENMEQLVCRVCIKHKMIKGNLKKYFFLSLKGIKGDRGRLGNIGEKVS